MIIKVIAKNDNRITWVLDKQHKQYDIHPPRHHNAYIGNSLEAYLFLSSLFNH